MPDARYLRSQAELCLQMAQGMREDRVAGNLRAAAAQYYIRALEVERPPAAAHPTYPIVQG